MPKYLPDITTNLADETEIKSNKLYINLTYKPI